VDAGRHEGHTFGLGALLRLLYDLGLRMAEAVGLDVEDLRNIFPLSINSTVT
jgi:hypothetical protein